jgi:hypothetical protein
MFSSTVLLCIKPALRAVLVSREGSVSICLGCSLLSVERASQSATSLRLDYLLAIVVL